MKTKLKLENYSLEVKLTKEGKKYKADAIVDNVIVYTEYYDCSWNTKSELHRWALLRLESKIREFIINWNYYDPKSLDLVTVQQDDLKLHNVLMDKLPNNQKNSEPKKEPKKCGVCCMIKKEFKRLKMFCCKKKEK